MTNISREQLVALFGRLAESQSSWNDAMDDGDRGRGDRSMVIILHEDGSGYVGDSGRVRELSNTNLVEALVAVQGKFGNTGELVAHLIEMHDVLGPPGASSRPAPEGVAAPPPSCRPDDAERLLKGLRQLMNCTGDMWACAFAEALLGGRSVEEARRRAAPWVDDEERRGGGAGLRARLEELSDFAQRVSAALGAPPPAGGDHVVEAAKQAAGVKGRAEEVLRDRASQLYAEGVARPTEYLGGRAAGMSEALDLITKLDMAPAVAEPAEGAGERQSQQ